MAQHHTNGLDGAVPFAVVFRMVPGSAADVSMAGDFDQATGVLAARGTTLYYTSGGVVYQMVPASTPDISMAADFDYPVTSLAVK